MKTTLRKQYSNNYQVFEITVEDAPKDSTDAILRAMDALAKKELGTMVAIVGEVSAPQAPKPTQPYTPSAPRPTYNNSPRPQQGGDVAPSVKQLEWLKKKGIPFDPATITKQEASRLLDGVFGHDKDGGAPKPSYNNQPAPQYNEPTPPSTSFDIDLPF